MAKVNNSKHTSDRNLAKQIEQLQNQFRDISTFKNIGNGFILVSITYIFF